jgi:predicted HAD superfamily Cof-like phosphohydrolase
MNKWQRDVRDFEYEMFGREMPERPTTLGWDEVKLRCSLITEEVNETIMALAAGDLEGVADGIGDAIYVLLGTAVRCGIDMMPVWDAIQRSNMAKAGGPLDPKTGKQLKPEGWTPPDIAGELARQGWRR